MDGAAIAGFWGLVGGSALLIGAAIAYFARLPQRLIAAIMAAGSGVLISAVAFDLMDEASSRVRIRNSTTPLSVKEAAKVLDTVRREKEEAIAQQQYEYAAELRDRELKLGEKLEGLETECQSSSATSFTDAGYYQRNG